MAIKRRLTSIHAPTMNTGRKVASVSKRTVQAAPAKPATTPRKPRTPKTESEKKFDNGRAKVLKDRREGAGQKAGSKSAKERYNERLAKWTADSKREADIAKLKRDCFNKNVQTAAANRKAALDHSKKALDIRLKKRKDNLAKTKPLFKDNKLIVPKLSAEERKAVIPPKPARKPMLRVNTKEMKLVEVHPKPRKPKGHVDAQLSKADKKASKRHTVQV